MEEIDLCWRLKNLGYKICYCADSTVYHVGGGTLEKSNPKKTFLNFRNNRILLQKNKNEKELVSINSTRNKLDKLAELVAQLKGNNAEATAIQQGIAEFQSTIQKWNNKRKQNETLQKDFTIGLPNKIGIFEHSIIWNYYIKGIKKFSQLKF
jgi:hypothetical protein